MSESSAVPTYILESDGLFREGLRLILSTTRFRPRGCATALDELTEVPGDKAVLFIVGEGADQAETYSRIRKEYPLAFIVAVADESNSRSLASALEDGANAVLFRSVSPSALLSTLQAVMNGKVILIDARLWSLEMHAKAEERFSPVLQNEERPSPPLQNEISWDIAEDSLAIKDLSAREVAILERIVRGDSNKHVARYFKIAEPTVKAHVKAIFRKIGASNRTQAAIWAIHHKLFEGTAGLPVLLHNGTGSNGASEEA
jgi:two-component system nitrate/nitrite response regulator NarL